LGETVTGFLAVGSLSPLGRTEEALQRKGNKGTSLVSFFSSEPAVVNSGGVQNFKFKIESVLVIQKHTLEFELTSGGLQIQDPKYAHIIQDTEYAVHYGACHVLRRFFLDQYFS
jgi:hypothetical protein